VTEINHERVLRLVELIYDAASDPAMWRVVLEELVDLTGGTGADLAGFDLRAPSGSIHVGVGAMTTDFQRDYEKVAHLDPFLLRAKDRGWFKAGTIGLGDDLISVAEFERTEFYRSFACRYDYIGGICAIIASTGRSGAAVGICRSRESQFDATHVELLRILMPHLQRAWHLHVQLADREEQRSSLAEALERLNLYLLIVRLGGTVVYANEPARALLAECDGLALDGGLLRGARSQDTRALDDLITTALAASPSGTAEPAGVLQLRRPSGRRPLRVIVSPLPRNQKLAISEPRALVYVIDPDDTGRPDTAILRRAYGLSRAEAEVAALLMQDKTVKEVSQLLGTTVHTVRFHIRQLFGKTGVSRQSALVRLLSAASHVRLTDRAFH